MAAAKTTASLTSSFDFLKEALILPTRNLKLFAPVFFLLVVFPTFFVLATNVFSIQPLAMDIIQLAIKLQGTDPSSSEYARLLEEMKHDVRQFILVTAACMFVSVVLGFVKQLVAFFAASTTYSGDQYSLPELLLKVMKGNLKGPSITIALVSILEFTSMVLLAALLSSTMTQQSNPKVFSIQGGLLFLLGFLAFLYFSVVGIVSIAVSVADTECRGMSALRQAWRLMTRVRRKEGLVLVVFVHLLPMAWSPLYLLALAYAKKSMALGLCLLAMYALLSGAAQLIDSAAATVYYFEATESKDEEAMANVYAIIPSSEASC